MHKLYRYRNERHDYLSPHPLPFIVHDSHVRASLISPLAHLPKKNKNENNTDKNTTKCQQTSSIRSRLTFRRNDNDEGDVEEETYEGQLNEAGEPSGDGIYTWSNGDVYDGAWLDGLRHGRGAMRWVDGGTYVGEWWRGERDGVAGTESNSFVLLFA